MNELMNRLIIIKVESELQKLKINNRRFIFVYSYISY